MSPDLACSLDALLFRFMPNVKTNILETQEGLQQVITQTWHNFCKGASFAERDKFMESLSRVSWQSSLFPNDTVARIHFAKIIRLRDSTLPGHRSTDEAILNDSTLHHLLVQFPDHIGLLKNLYQKHKTVTIKLSNTLESNPMFLQPSEVYALMLKSAFFRAFFGWAFTETFSINMHAGQLRTLISFAMGIKLLITEDNSEELVVLADQYLIPDLLEEVVHCFLNRYSEEDLTKLLLNIEDKENHPFFYTNFIHLLLNKVMENKDEYRAFMQSPETNQFYDIPELLGPQALYLEWKKVTPSIDIYDDFFISVTKRRLLNACDLETFSNIIQHSAIFVREVELLTGSQDRLNLLINCPYLQSLSLYGGSITKGITIGMGDKDLKFLSQLPTLEYVSIKDQGCFTMAGLMALAQIPNLKSLQLKLFKDITDQDLMLLSTIPFIERINLEQNENITDQGLAYLVNLPHLKTLVLHSCPNISIDGLVKLAQNSLIAEIKVVHCNLVKDKQGVLEKPGLTVNIR